jgi:AcrR family transcriptional regulator
MPSRSAQPDAAGGRADGRRLRGEASRRAIIQAAVRVVSGQGLAAVTHRAVATEAGVSVALTTYHFGTLDDLLAASLTELARAGAARLADATNLARAGEVSLLDACSGHLIELFGPRRGEFLADLEIRLSAARNTKIHSAAGQADAGFIELIDTFTHDRARAHAIFVAILGFAVASVITSPVPAEQEIRTFMRRILTRYDLIGPAPLAG